MALAEDGSLSPGREGPCWPRAGAGPLPLQDCWAAVPTASSVVSQPEVRVSLATKTLPMPGCRGVAEAEIGQTARRSALSPFSEMALFEKCLCGGGAGQGDLGKKRAVSRKRSPGAPPSDHLAKAPPSGHSGRCSFFPNPEWEKGEDGLNLFMAPAAPGSGAPVRVRPPEGEANNGLHVLPVLSLQEQGTGGADPSRSGLEMSQGPSFPVALEISASPWSLQALEQPPSSRPQGLIAWFLLVP